MQSHTCYCYVEYSELTMQLPQHCTYKTKRHIPYTIVPVPHERKQLHESEYNSHESEIGSIHEFHLDTETSRLLIANWFRQNIFTNKRNFFK